jgi:UMF1 family MFS transporter
LWAYATGIAELIAAVLAPVLGAIADAGQPRKPWIAGFSLLLVVGMCGLWLAAPGRTDLAPLVLFAFGLAIIGAELATVFNNAMMTSLVSGRKLGTLSGAGWATGYVGGLVSLALVAWLPVADPSTGKTLLGLQPPCRSIRQRARATVSSDRSRRSGISCSCCRSFSSRRTRAPRRFSPARSAQVSRNSCAW